MAGGGNSRRAPYFPAPLYLLYWYKSADTDAAKTLGALDDGFGGTSSTSLLALLAASAILTLRKL